MIFKKNKQRRNFIEKKENPLKETFGILKLKKPISKILEEIDCKE